MSFSNVLIVPNVEKKGIADAVYHLIRFLNERKVSHFLLSEDADKLSIDVPIIESPHLEEIDLAVILGGDGTMLYAVDLLWGKKIPLIGLNIGKLGFLTAGEIHQMEELLDNVFSGHYCISERIGVGCTLRDDHSKSYRAINEIVVGKLMRERLIHLSTYINGEFFMKYSGDGLIFSSATGSTAYSLSAGGPIVTPELKCFLLTPICAHMLFSRPMVMDIKDIITVCIEEKPQRVALSIDGRREVEVPPGTSIDFYAHDEPISIIEVENFSFYRTVTRKFLNFSGSGR